MTQNWEWADDDRQPEWVKALLRALDRAIEAQVPAARRAVRTLRDRHPDHTPERILRTLERGYLTGVVGTGAGVGAAAAVPGLGTGAAVALTTGEALTSIEAGALLTLSYAEVHGVAVTDRERRRAIVMTALVGSHGLALWRTGAGSVGGLWAGSANDGASATALRQIHGALVPLLVSRFGAGRGAVALGRFAPFGIGAAVGAGGGALVARPTITTLRTAFGEPPIAWPPSPEPPVVVDAV